ncbi:unnamed protein product [Aspergillus oryzae]|uniref:Unnamed protein product n=1 Tax=Aspergillus oryzae TaxID=5062 RepID=A0AAN4YV72_ASPOZ|nr:unnamed protein product [Aspergillus oryzae]GMG37449.1 unnamed protein product [Aspergillus oryzae]
MTDCVSTSFTTRLSNRQCGIAPHKGRPEVDSATLVPLIFSTLLFANRIAAKFMGLGGGWGPDDYTIIVAYVRFIMVPMHDRTLAKTDFSLWL